MDLYLVFVPERKRCTETNFHTNTPSEKEMAYISNLYHYHVINILIVKNVEN
jgi:hypothetical protein